MHGYKRDTLVGNWYEERMAVKQPVRENPDVKYVREDEHPTAISFLASDNHLRPLGKVNRQLPWNTKGVIADDGFREYKTLSKTDFNIERLQNFYGLGDGRNIVKTTERPAKRPENDTHVQTSEVKDYRLINPKNFADVLERQRAVRMENSDFGSTLKKHDREHDRLYTMTNYQDAFSRPKPETAHDIINKHEAGGRAQKPAGWTKNQPKLEGIAMTSVLTGEKYREGYDPQHNTEVQRAWLPAKDKALYVAKNNLSTNDNINKTRGLSASNFDRLKGYRENMSQVNDYDNATSLPMATGAYDIQNKHWGPGNFRHIRTDVTIVKNKPLTKK